MCPTGVRRLDGEQREEPSGAFGAQRCQASTTRAASDHDHPAWKIVTVLTGWVVNEPCGDPEIAATAPTQAPEQVRVSLRVALPDDPVRGHHRSSGGCRR